MINEKGFQCLALVVHIEIVSESDFQDLFQMLFPGVHGSLNHLVDFKVLGHLRTCLQELVGCELVRGREEQHLPVKQGKSESYRWL